MGPAGGFRRPAAFSSYMTLGNLFSASLHLAWARGWWPQWRADTEPLRFPCSYEFQTFMGPEVSPLPVLLQGSRLLSPSPVGGGLSDPTKSGESQLRSQTQGRRFGARSLGFLLVSCVYIGRAVARTLWPSGEGRGLARGDTAVQTPHEAGLQTGMLESVPRMVAAALLGAMQIICRKIGASSPALPPRASKGRTTETSSAPILSETQSEF